VEQGVGEGMTEAERAQQAEELFLFWIGWEGRGRLQGGTWKVLEGGWGFLGLLLLVLASFLFLA